MNKKYIQLDAGHTIINICCEAGKNGMVCTAYINGLSVKSPALNLSRIERIFIASVVTACDFPDDGNSPKHIERLGDDIRNYIELERKSFKSNQ